MGMSQKIYKPRRRIPLVMGEKKAVTILGNIIMYRDSTGLETVADETARNMGVLLPKTHDDMQPGSWMYCYSKEGKKNGKEINYHLYCFAEQEGADIPVDRAIATIKKKIGAGEFSEDFWVFDENHRLYVQQNPSLVEPGKYLVTEDSKPLGEVDLATLKAIISQVF